MNEKKELKVALEKEEDLRQQVLTHSPLIVAFSGGVDSSYLAFIAFSELTDDMVAVLGISPSLSASENERARGFLKSYSIPNRIVQTEEINNPLYRKNAGDRCFHCKEALFKECERVAKELGFVNVAYGYNLDDADDFRPGDHAARKYNVLRPLFDVGLNKQEIRLLSKFHSLPNYSRPSQPCLASRLAYNTEVTEGNLQIVERIEILLSDLGFLDKRARYDGVTLRIEVPENDIDRLSAPENRKQIVNCAFEMGVKFVSVDLEGLKSGKQNRVLSVIGGRP